MPRQKRNDFLIPALGVIFDAIFIEAAFMLSYILRFNTRIFEFLPLTEDIPPVRAYLLSSLAVIPVWLVIFQHGKMYGGRRNIALSDELYNIVKYISLGMLIILSGAFFYRQFSYSRIVFLLIWSSSIILVFAGRVMLHIIERSLYRKGRELRNAVIIGSNAAARKVYGSLINHPLLGYKVVGYFADDVNGGEPLPVKFLGRLAEVPSKLLAENVEFALITLDHTERQKLYDLVKECEGINVEFVMVPDILELMTSTMEIVEIEGIPLIKIKGIPMTTWGRILKRTFDFLISLILIVILSPLYIIVALIVKLDSKGPVFYTQKRMGEGDHVFNILKFRSMAVDAEKEGPKWAHKDETRHTRIGKYLRMTSLDELPQLFNVLRGDMSLVGPRPERPYFVEQFKDMIPKYLDRHRVKTGMTGWAQVNGLRGDSSLEERIKYDIYYIENWSLGFDIKILFKTIAEVFDQILRHIKGKR
ncbi:MAG: undecaprenyl-phosphate glucose phosphotransferase [Bacteroidota bacterium]